MLFSLNVKINKDNSKCFLLQITFKQVIDVSCFVKRLSKMCM